MPKITPIGYAAMAVIIGGAVLIGGKFALNKGILGKPTDVVAMAPEATSITHFTVNDSAASYALPVTAKASPPQGCPVMEVLAWNAEGGLDLANGGAQTSRDSMVSKYTNGGCLMLQRQDDYGQMEANLAKFVQSNGQNGDFAFIIMGDAYPYVASALDGLIPGKYSAIAAIGFSDGEDQCMLPSNWRDLMKAGTPILIAAVPRDGDWNICTKFASDNGIKLNVDQKTVDPSAFNFMDVDAFTTADEKLISHACEDRTLVSGSLAHGSKNVCVNGVATWTPGDVDVVNKFNGSIVGVASTHDYAGQMPALIIGAKDWMQQHHDYVVGLLQATDRGSQAIRSGQNGLMAMGQVHAQIFKEQDAAYWAKYYTGAMGQNHAGENVHLGGSKVITLQEERDYFGMRPGTENVYASVYRVFKGYDETFYPTLYPKSGKGAIPEYASAVDTSYLSDALSAVPQNQGVVVSSLAVAAPISTTVSKKSWHIEFDTGSAKINPSSFNQLYQIEDSANVAQGLRIRFDGYTDNTGSAAANIPLSNARAQAVADWLTSKASASFPASRMEARGHGEDAPICPANDTADCKAQNRRVEITLGN